MMASERLQKPVLVLNASYEPINICAARRALVLVLKGVASAEEESVNAVHSARALVRLPSVIRLLEYRRIPHQTRAPVLPPGDAFRRTDAGSRDTAVARRRDGLGKPGGLLPSLQ